MIILLSISLFLLVLLVLVLIIKLNWNSVMSIILIPFLLFNIGFSWYTIDYLWGQAKESVPESKSQILFVEVEKPWVYIVVRQPNKELRFHKISYSKQMEQEVAKMKKEMKKGQPLFIDGIDKNNSKLKWYKWDYHKMLPKSR